MISYKKLKLPKGVLSPLYKELQILPQINVKLQRSSSTSNVNNYNKKSARNHNRVFIISNAALSPKGKFSKGDLYNSTNKKLKRSESKQILKFTLRVMNKKVFII